jgi:hypothetical protein
MLKQQEINMYSIKLKTLCFLALLFINIVPLQAQAVITRLCDTAFDPNSGRIPYPFPGTYYWLDTQSRDFGIARLGRIDQNGTTEVEAPIPSERVQELGSPLISPDGRYAAFRPRIHRGATTIFVWKINTDEFAELTLTTQELEHFAFDEDEPEYVWLNELVWQDSTHLQIQYFDPEGYPDGSVTAITEFAIIESPLQILRGEIQPVLYPSLIAPPDNLDPRAIFSPQGTYTTLISDQVTPNYGHARRIQIYESQTLQLVFDRASVETNLIWSEPIWSPSESVFVYQEARNSTYPLIMIDVTAGFVENRALGEALETEFGTGTDLMPTFLPTFNQVGDLMAFQIRTPSQRYQMIVYNIITQNITAICDPLAPPSGVFPLIFWSPDGQYVGYRYGENAAVFGINDGNIYILPAEGSYVSWVNSSSTTTPTPIETPTETPTLTLTPSPTPMLTPAPCNAYGSHRCAAPIRRSRGAGASAAAILTKSRLRGMCIAPRRRGR